MTRLTITKPDDWHLHVRDGKQMQSVINETARYYRRALIMPNLKEPVKSVKLALEYKERILKALDPDLEFDPLMALYLTDETSENEILKAAENNNLLVVKLYPSGATTNSSSGVTSIEACDKLFEKMQQYDIPLSVHGEVTRPEVDIFDREKIFIDEVLAVIAKRYPELRIVFEHISTKEAVQFVASSSNNIAGTITIHHLLLNRNDMLVNGINPHYFCLPIIKKRSDQLALIEAATSGNPKYFLGTDSAPHPKNSKECGSGKAGIFSSPVSLPLYVELFEREAALDRFEAFASFNGADFYKLPRNKEKINLQKTKHPVPKSIPFGGDEVVPIFAGESLQWKME